jgi:hypothetical protein
MVKRFIASILGSPLSLSVLSIFKRKESPAPLSEREILILAREEEESRRSAMPNESSSNLNGGPLTSSKMQATVNHNGPSAVISRRNTEPRNGWTSEDKKQT